MKYLKLLHFATLILLAGCTSGAISSQPVKEPTNFYESKPIRTEPYSVSKIITDVNQIDYHLTEFVREQALQERDVLSHDILQIHNSRYVVTLIVEDKAD